MNLSIGAAIRGFGDVALNACKEELLQLFVEKGELTPVKWEDLNDEQKKNAVRSHMFLKEKHEDGKFIKMKARLVEDGRMQDREVYNDYSSPTAKTRSIMTCLKLAAVKNWDLLELDVGGAFLCAPIDEGAEVFMFLDKGMTEMCVDCMPQYKEFVREDGKLFVRVDKAMYGLIQSAKLWYKELTGHLMKHGFKKCKTDECVLIKKMPSGEYMIVLLYVDDILVISKCAVDRHWVKSLLESKYEKMTHQEGERLPYLGMTILKTAVGFEICMRSYIEDVLKLYDKDLREYVVPAKKNVFEVHSSSMIEDREKIHSVVAKLLSLGKRGRPDILMPVQFLCTRVRNPTLEDERKLEQVLGYLKLAKNWTRAFDRSKFERVVTYIDASFAAHDDGKGQSACVVMLGNTVVHEACTKQKIITRNSTEAELVALSDYIGEGELIEDFLMELGHIMDDDLLTNVHLIYQDNQSTIALVQKGGGKQRTKYIKVRQEYIHERLGTSEVEIAYSKTCDMLADIFTKGLGGDQFHTLAEAVLGKHRFSYSSNGGAKSNIGCDVVKILFK